MLRLLGDHLKQWWEISMIRDALSMSAATITLMTAGCVTVTAALAPGAAAVRIVRSEADVASCTAVETSGSLRIRMLICAI